MAHYAKINFMVNTSNLSFGVVTQRYTLFDTPKNSAIFIPFHPAKIPFHTYLLGTGSVECLVLGH